METNGMIKKWKQNYINMGLDPKIVEHLYILQNYVKFETLCGEIALILLQETMNMDNWNIINEDIWFVIPCANDNKSIIVCIGDSENKKINISELPIYLKIFSDSNINFIKKINLTIMKAFKLI